MRLGLTIDLDTCVGCHACAVACKEWNGESLMAGPLPDYKPYGNDPSGVCAGVPHSCAIVWRFRRSRFGCCQGFSGTRHETDAR